MFSQSRTFSGLQGTERTRGGPVITGQIGVCRGRGPPDLGTLVKSAISGCHPRGDGGFLFEREIPPQIQIGEPAGYRKADVPVFFDNITP
jgi:hypothetical protein